MADADGGNDGTIASGAEVWLHERRGDYSSYCRTKVKEAEAELGEWVEGKERVQ